MSAMMQYLRWLALAGYLAACLFCLSAMFGDTPRPVAGMFGLLLGLPWSAVLAVFGALSPLASVLILAVCMTLNAALLLALIRATSKRSRGAAPDKAG